MKTLHAGRPDAVERFLAALRATHPDMVRIYTNGGCFHLFTILRQIWPQARPWSDCGHVWTEIGGRFYDIEGRHLVLPDYAHPMDELELWRGVRWHSRMFWHEKATPPPSSGHGSSDRTSGSHD